jgi:hypothetical protein
MRINLHTSKNLLSKHKVYYMKMARIFQQCANCFKKESCVNTVAPLVNSFGTFSQIFDMKTMIF